VLPDDAARRTVYWLREDLDPTAPLGDCGIEPFPRSPTGKLLKREIRSDLLQGT